jgi:Fe-S cluster biogenesis protein NfuA
MNISEIKEKVLLALDEIRPFLASDGGDISLESIKDEKNCIRQTSWGMCRLLG